MSFMNLARFIAILIPLGLFGCLSLDLPAGVKCKQGVCTPADAGSGDTPPSHGGGGGGGGGRPEGGASGTGGRPNEDGGTANDGDAADGTDGNVIDNSIDISPIEGGVDRPDTSVDQSTDVTAMTDTSMETGGRDASPACVSRAPGKLCLSGPGGFVDVLSTCDDQGRETTTACEGLCVNGACLAATCGDGKLQSGEACDDGNVNALDGCDACRLEWIPEVGWSHVCVRSAAGVICWGRNHDGQTGNASSPFAPPSSYVIRGATRSVSCGANHTCAVLVSGELQCWGNGTQGQLGRGTKDAQPIAMPMGATAFATALASLSANVKAVSAATGNTFVVTSTGKILSAGSNDSGALGDLGTAARTTPAAIDLGGALVSDVARRGQCAILSDGQIDCWGENAYGQLGNGTTSTGGTPNPPARVKLPLGTKVTKVDGPYTRCALVTNGDVWCWGYALVGQIGNGTIGDANAIVAMPAKASLSGAAQGLTVGSNHVCALMTSGDAYCWGEGINGALGVSDSDGKPDFAKSALPKKVALGNRKAKAISAGENLTCALLSDNKVYCWGKNAFGGLGIAPPSDSEPQTRGLPDLTSPVDLPY